MSWTKFYEARMTDPRIKMIQRAIGNVTEPHVWGALVALWLVGRKHGKARPDGSAILPGWTAELLDEQARTPGLTAALSDPRVDWARVQDRGIVLPRFAEKNATAEDDNKRSAQRMAKSRARCRNVARNTSATDVQHVGPVAPVFAAREEKRREEENREEQKRKHHQPGGDGGGGGVSADAPVGKIEPNGITAPLALAGGDTHPAEPQGAADATGGIQDDSGEGGPVKITLNAEARRWEGVTPDDLAAWRTAYPAVNVTLAMAQAAEWCVSNPAKGKKKNYRRFLTSWFSREQERGGGSAKTPAASAAPAQPKIAQGAWRVA